MLSDKKISITDHTHKAPLALHTLSLMYLQAQGFIFKREFCFTNRILLIRSHKLRVLFSKRGVLFQRQKSTNNYNSSFWTLEKYVMSDELEKQKMKREKKAAFQICDVLCRFGSGDPDHWKRDPSIALKMPTKASCYPRFKVYYIFQVHLQQDTKSMRSRKAFRNCFACWWTDLDPDPYRY